MALTDKFNFYLNMYKTLNPGVGVGVNSLDGFLNFIKKRYPSFYNQAQAQVREIMRQAQPQSSGNGQKPPTNPPTKNDGGTPEFPKEPNKKNYTGTKQQISPQRQAEIDKGLDELYKKPTSKDNLAKTYQNKKIVKGNLGNFTTNAIDTTKQAAKTVSNIKPQSVGGMIKGVGTKLYQSAVPLTYGVGLIQNWNAPGSDWRTRTLDTLGLGESIIDSTLATLIPNPVAGFTVGTLGSGRAAANKAGIQGIREQNLNNATNSVKDLSPEQQQAYERYLATGKGGQLPTGYKAPNFMEGVEGSDLNVKLETPKQIRKKLGLDINQLDDNPPIANPSTLPETSASSQQESPKQVITGDGSVVASRANGSGSYTPTDGNGTVNFNSDNNENNFINNVINGANNMTVDEAIAGLVQPTTGMASNIDASTDAMINQLMSTEGYITPQQMQDLIRKEYESIRNVNVQNPYYGGEYIQPGGYQIDPNELSKRQAEDEVLRRTAIYGGGNAYTGNLAQNYIDNQRQMYNAEMANRAGVPYEDYVKGMTDRNANDILSRAKEVEQQLTNYANQTNDMKVKLQVVQALQLNRQNTQAKLDEIFANTQRDIAIHKMDNETKLREQLLQNQGNLNVANAQGINQLTNTQYQLNHPSNMMKATGSLLGSGALAFYQNPQGLANFLAALAPQYHRALFGKVMNPNDMNDIFTVQQAIQSNPNAFVDFLNKYNIFNQGQ